MAGRHGGEPAVRQLRQPVQQPRLDVALLQRDSCQRDARRGRERADQRRRRRRRVPGRTTPDARMRLPVALTIAGSDSGGGAGIQADLKTFAALGVHGTCAITAITAQNTVTVTDIHEVPVGVIRAQIDAVVEDLGVDAAKTGMLASSDIIEAVADAIRDHGIDRLVVDPVMVAKGGARLLHNDAIAALFSRLLPLAAVITPNIPEAEVLLGRSLHTLDDRRQAARELVALGPRAAVLKGGHADTDAIDFFF